VLRQSGTGVRGESIEGDHVRLGGGRQSGKKKRKKVCCSSSWGGNKEKDSKGAAKDQKKLHKKMELWAEKTDSKKGRAKKKRRPIPTVPRSRARETKWDDKGQKTIPSIGGFAVRTDQARRAEGSHERRNAVRSEREKKKENPVALVGTTRNEGIKKHRGPLQ